MSTFLPAVFGENMMDLFDDFDRCLMTSTVISSAASAVRKERSTVRTPPG